MPLAVVFKIMALMEQASLVGPVTNLAATAAALPAAVVDIMEEQNKIPVLEQ
jgi:hypothetical protein